MSDSLPLETNVQAVKMMLDAGTDFLLLDVRERDEYEKAQIEGSTLMPLSEFERRASELDSKQQDHIVVHCHHGGRSMQVTEWLRSRGFDQAQNMTGGIQAWSTLIDPSVPTYQ